MDDGWLTEREKKPSKAPALKIRSDLCDSGLITDEEKCQ